jgi:hypothetical protein
MLTYLYHYQIGFPSSLKRLNGIHTLKYGHHAQRAAADDRYGRIVLPRILNADTALLVEAEVKPNGELLKAVYRVRYNDTHDLVLVVNRSNDGVGLFVRTVWLNSRVDSHKTLDRRRYAQPVK